MSHNFVDLFLHINHGPLGKMHIDKRGGDTLVAQKCLNHSQMDTSLQKMGSVRMPQRVAGYVLAYIALLEGCLQAVLYGVLGDGQVVLP